MYQFTPAEELRRGIKARCEELMGSVGRGKKSTALCALASDWSNK